MKTLKKITSVLLALIMICGIGAVPAFAEDEVLTPVLADPVNDPPVASDIERGQRLTLSKITGGTVKHPVTGEILTDARWRWSAPSTKIYEDGYQEAFCTSTQLGGVANKLVVKIYVKIQTVKIETEFSSYPVVPDFVYDGRTWEEIVDINECVVVERGTDKRVDGKLNFVAKTTAGPSAGRAGISILFTPDDPTKYTDCLIKIEFNVAEGTVAWASGETTQVLEVPHGKKNEGFLNFDNKLINAYNKNYPNGWSLLLYDLDKNPVKEKFNFEYGTYNYLAKPTSAYSEVLKNWNYDVYLPLTVVVVPIEASFKEVSYNCITEILKVIMCEPDTYGGSYNLNGTADIYIDDELIKDVPVTNGKFTVSWKPDDTSKDSTADIRIKYNGLEGENAVVKNEYVGEITYMAKRTLTIKHSAISAKVGSTEYNPEEYLTSGERISVSAKGRPDFLYWKITDTNGNPVDLKIVNNSIESNLFDFIMPECDLVLDAVFQYQLDQQEKLDNCTCRCHSDDPIIQFFWKIIIRIIDALKIFGVENECDCGFPHGTREIIG